MINKREFVKDFIQNKCVVHRETEKDILFNKNGKRFLWTFDLRELILNSELWAIIAEHFWETHKAQYPFQIAGPELAGAIAAPMLSHYIYAKHKVKINTFVVKNKKKKYCTRSLIEGEVLDLPIIIADDAINSLATVYSTITKILEERPTAIISEVFAIIDMKEEREKLDDLFKVRTLYTKREFITSTYSKIGQIKAKRPKINWIFSASRTYLPEIMPKCSPILYDSSIIFGSEPCILWCLDTKTGKVKWKFDTNSSYTKKLIFSPIIYNDTVYFGDPNGYIHSLNASTGAPTLRFKLCDWILSNPIIVDNKLIVSCAYKNAPFGEIICLNLDTLSREWTIPTKYVQYGFPVFSKEYNAILIGTNDSTLFVIDKDSGKVINCLETGGAIKSQATVQGSICVFGSFDEGIYIWDFVSNKLINKIRTLDVVQSKPLIYQGNIFIGSTSGDFYIIDLATGIIKSKIYCKSKIYSCPTLINGYIYFGSSNGGLIKLNSTSFEIESLQHFPKGLANTIVGNDTQVFVYDFTNTLYAIDLK